MEAGHLNGTMGEDVEDRMRIKALTRRISDAVGSSLGHVSMMCVFVSLYSCDPVRLLSAFTRLVGGIWGA